MIWKSVIKVESGGYIGRILVISAKKGGGDSFDSLSGSDHCPGICSLSL